MKKRLITKAKYKFECCICGASLGPVSFTKMKKTRKELRRPMNICPVCYTIGAIGVIMVGKREKESKPQNNK